ncbi:MAG: DUF1232 domain-containing protein [Rubritepida sp.]|nr:DUF1232 domain-containing protein [Rubritepida sp.]
MQTADQPPPARAFFGTLRANARRLGGPAAHQLLKLWFAGTGPGAPRRVKAVFYGALAYFVMPLDAVPDIIPVIGWGDDMAVVAAALAYASTHITDEARARAARVHRRIFGAA